MWLGRLITSGVDVWLNTPLRPNEASGTSGMKASLNGVPNLSVLDGWWSEGCKTRLNGWAIGNPRNIQMMRKMQIILYHLLKIKLFQCFTVIKKSGQL